MAYVCFLLEVDHLISINYIRWMIVLIIFVYMKVILMFLTCWIHNHLHGPVRPSVTLGLEFASRTSCSYPASCNNWSLLCAHMHTQPPPSNNETSQPCWDIISQSNVARSMWLCWTQDSRSKQRRRLTSWWRCKRLSKHKAACFASAASTTARLCKERNTLKRKIWNVSNKMLP